MEKGGSGESNVAYDSRTSDDIVDKARRRSRALVAERPLFKVNRLIVQAISGVDDNLHRFISARSVLEVLASKVFSEYEKRFIENLLGVTPQKHTARYSERIRDVMKDKYRLIDKFVVLSACISQDGAELNIKDFALIKEKRDAFFHGESMDEEGLSTFSTLKLLKKYLGLHVVTKGAQGVSEHTDIMPRI